MIGINGVGKKGERLANQMFQYAAVKGIAKNRGFTYCVPPSNFKSNAQQWEEHQLFVPFKLETFNSLQIQWLDPKRPVLPEKQFHFDEDLFKRSQQWLLSTSNVTAPFLGLFGFVLDTFWIARVVC